MDCLVCVGVSASDFLRGADVELFSENDTSTIQYNHRGVHQDANEHQSWWASYIKWECDRCWSVCLSDLQCSDGCLCVRESERFPQRVGWKRVRIRPSSAGFLLVQTAAGCTASHSPVFEQGSSLFTAALSSRVPSPAHTAQTVGRMMSAGSLCLLFDLLIQTLSPQSAQSG